MIIMVVVVEMMPFKITNTLITMREMGGVDADQGATKVDDDDIDSKHVNGGGGMIILMINMMMVMRGRRRSQMVCY